mgnify:CR=1 FL=1
MPSPLFSTMPRLVCLLIATLAPEVAAQAQEGAHEFVATYNVLHYFTGTPDDGATAETAPTRVPDGSYYGTSGRGGAFDFGSV